MPDLRERFRALDDLEVPDVMSRALFIGPKPPTPETPPRSRRVTALVFAAVIALAAIVIVFRAFDGSTSQPADPPTPTPVPTPTPEPSPSPTPAPSSTTVDIAFVDLRTGKTTPLPSSIRAVDGADHFQASPDGGRLAFTSGDRIYLANVDGSNLREIADGTTPMWSPDGESLVSEFEGELRVVDVDTGSFERIFDGGELVFHPNFSQDGQHILFTWLKPGTAGFAVWTVPLDGGSPQAVPLPPSGSSFPAFGTYSPDGTAIAYRQTQYDGVDRTEMTTDTVWVARSDGTDPRPLGLHRASMSQIDPTFLWPMWSPDGTRIAYEHLYSGRVFVIELSTGHWIRVGDGSNPTWLDNHTLIIEEFDGEKGNL